MKIKIKSIEEIEKTLERAPRYCSITDVGQYKGSTLTMRKEMLEFCGMESEVKRVLDDDRALAFDWFWHKEWYEVVEDFNEEDLMDIELMNEMLAYFMEVENGN